MYPLVVFVVFVGVVGELGSGLIGRMYKTWSRLIVLVAACVWGD